MSRGFLSLSQAGAGAAVFIDANIFLYHFLGRSEECSRFLERCASGEVRGATGAHVLAEVLHRSMIFEARANKAVGLGAGKGKGKDVGEGGGARSTVGILRASPAAVRKLTDHHATAAAIIDMGIVVFPLTAEIVRASQWGRSRNGLMVNDSLVVATMRAHGLTALATADKDFGEVEGIEIFGPADVQN
jgi:predicted nucleic acid-binding protein